MPTVRPANRQPTPDSRSLQAEGSAPPSAEASPPSHLHRESLASSQEKADRSKTKSSPILSSPLPAHRRALAQLRQRHSESAPIGGYARDHTRGASGNLHTWWHGSSSSNDSCR